MQQPAVEWFADRIKHGGLVSKKQFDELLEQAKKMEMEQTIGFGDEYEYYFLCGGKATMEQYYNETYLSSFTAIKPE